MKLYLTPSDQKTIEELSQEVGKTTRRLVKRSRAVGRNPFEGRSVSERTEETALLREDEARRLSLDEVILVVDAQMPVRARRIKYYEDPKLSALHAAQSGPMPWPDAQQLQVEGRLKETEAQLTRLARDLRVLCRAGGGGGWCLQRRSRYRKRLQPGGRVSLSAEKAGKSAAPDPVRAAQRFRERRGSAGPERGGS